MNVRELKSRLTLTTKPSRELDCWIHRCLGYRALMVECHGVDAEGRFSFNDLTYDQAMDRYPSRLVQIAIMYLIPHYTRDVDRILEIIPDKFHVHMDGCGEEWNASIQSHFLSSDELRKVRRKEDVFSGSSSSSVVQPLSLALCTAYIDFYIHWRKPYDAPAATVSV